MSIRTDYNGSTYYVNVFVESDQKTIIYFSHTDNLCAEGDEVLSLYPSIKLFDGNNIQLGCNYYKNWDAATKIAGCLSVAASVFCGLATIPTDGAAAFFCSSVWEYAADKGAADCLKGIAGAIAEELKENLVWASFAITLAIEEGDYTEILTNILDLFCDRNFNPVLEIP